MLKRFFVCLIAVLCLFSFCACSGGDKGNGGNNQGGNTKLTDEEIIDGIIKKSTGEYLIESEEGLNYFRDIIHGEVSWLEYDYFKGATVKLGKDMDFEGADWLSIMENDSGDSLNGLVFDGCGHYIKGLYLTENRAIYGDYPMGFFGFCASDITIKNVKFIDVTCGNGKTGTSPLCLGKWVGVIVGYHRRGNLTIENCTVDDCALTFSTSNGSIRIGGIIGYTQEGKDDKGDYGLTVKDCKVLNSIFSGKGNVSGLFGTIFYHKEPAYADIISVENNSVKNCTFTMSSDYEEYKTFYGNNEYDTESVLLSDNFFENNGNTQSDNQFILDRKN